MYKPLCVAGLILLVAGLAALAYSFKWESDLEATVDSILADKEWNVTWYEVVASDGTFGRVIGSSTLPARFVRRGITYTDPTGKEWSDTFGFEATLTVEIPRDLTVIFRAGSDDGIMLLVDGEVVINGWRLRGYTIDEAEFKLSAGRHEFKLKYYEWYGGQDASFDVKLADWRTAMSTRTNSGGVSFLGGFLAALGAILPPTILKRKKTK
jgi:hypothetical protein